VQVRKTSLRNDLAFHFFTDATDFLDRFDILYEEYSKTKRFKCFVDLLMGFECILKSHIFLSHKSESMEEIYRLVKKTGHDLSKLADLSSYLDDATYKNVKDELGEYSVFIRYSLDAYEHFLPSFVGFGEGKFNYSSTMTNDAWMMKMRNLLSSLIDPTATEFTGLVKMDLDNIFDDEKRLREFAIKVGIVKS
jgi:hypothetical protein